MVYYLITKFFVRIYYRIFFRVTVTGVENVPETSAAIICANHTSNYDCVTLSAYIKRLPNYIAKKELFSVPVLGWYLKKLKAIPVDRENMDLKAYKKAVKVLTTGELLGIFVEGRRVSEGDEAAAKAGAALFALKTGAPIIPAGIKSSYKLFSNVTLRYGEPLDLTQYNGKRVTNEILDEVTNKIMEKIKELKA